MKCSAEVGLWIKKGHLEEDIKDIPYNAKSVGKFGAKYKTGGLFFSLVCAETIGPFCERSRMMRNSRS